MARAGALRASFGGAQAGLDCRQHARGRRGAGARGACGSCCSRTPNALLLLVPRHPDRFDAVAELLRRGAVRFARRSGGERPDARARKCVLVDTVGELAALYAAADVAFVGGSLVPIGGHNLLEPAALGLPVLTGPSYFNGKDIAHLLLTRGAALRGCRMRASWRRRWRACSATSTERQRMGAIGHGDRRVESRQRRAAARAH